MLAIAIAAVLPGCGRDANDNSSSIHQSSNRHSGAVDSIRVRQADIFRWLMPTPAVDPRSAEQGHRLPGVRGNVGVEAEWGDYLRGYRDASGPPEHEAALVRALDGCEAGQWEGYYGDNSYWSRAQFSLDTWAKIVAHYAWQGAERVHADNPYSVGLAVGYWASVVSDVPGNWPHCYGGPH